MNRRIIITAALIAGLLLTLTTMTVKSQNKDQIKIDEKFYHQMETEYIDEMKQLLEARGFQNTGITMTKVYLENGARDYTVVIHNKYINRMNEADRQELQDELKGLSFPLPDCSFFHKFLITES